jgi:hypothetical protein
MAGARHRRRRNRSTRTRTIARKGGELLDSLCHAVPTLTKLPLLTFRIVQERRERQKQRRLKRSERKNYQPSHRGTRNTPLVGKRTIATTLIATPVFMGLGGSVFWAASTMLTNGATATADARQANLDTKKANTAIGAANVQLADVLQATGARIDIGRARCVLFISQDHSLSCDLLSALNRGSLAVNILAKDSVSFIQSGPAGEVDAYVQTDTSFQEVPADLFTMVNCIRAFLRASPRELQVLRAPAVYRSVAIPSVSVPAERVSVTERLQTALKDLSAASVSVTEAARATDGAIAAAAEYGKSALILGFTLIPLSFTVIGGLAGGVVAATEREAKHGKRRSA